MPTIQECIPHTYNPRMYHTYLQPPEGTVIYWQNILLVIFFPCDKSVFTFKMANHLFVKSDV